MSEVLTVAKIQSIQDEFEICGVAVRLIAVPIGIVQDAIARLVTPKVPMFFDDDKQREYENPNDPEYLKALDEHRKKVGTVTMEACCMFGIELPDGMPEDDSWLKRLKYMEKKEILDLSDVDWDDEIDIEYLFKRYVVGTTEVIAVISQKTSVTQGAIAQAKSGFRR